MAELLIELLSEEIPARMQAKASEDFWRLISEGLTDNKIDHDGIEVYVGPRRLALVATGLPIAQKDVSEEKKGPAVGAPEQAIAGFVRANNLTSIAEAKIRPLAKGDFYFAVSNKAGRPTAVVLKELIEAALAQLPWPKSMRWATNPARWVRPLHRMVCVFDGGVIKVAFAGVTAGDITVGHRFLAPAEIKVANFADYGAKLKQAFVMIDPAERSDVIEKRLAKLAADEELTVRHDPGLLAEVTGLVEWPVPLLGTIDAKFMDVPAEVLTSAMRKHQKYFALADATGKFSSRFGVIANMVNADGGKVVVAGNERVLRARLSDAKFFWDKDRERRLETRVDKLKERVFQAKLGTVYDKVIRLQSLVQVLAAPCVHGANFTEVVRAAHLCKADLSTEMVGEFPDLQGIMGRYYALNDHETLAVADAIAEHYSPLGPNDACPTKPVSVVVALADKIDTLTGFFGINEKPTGSKDPYALRRAALGVIRLILDNKLRLQLIEIFEKAIHFHGGAVIPASAADARSGKLVDVYNVIARQLLEFFADRLKVYLRDQGMRHDLISAVFAVEGDDDLWRLIERVKALDEFLSSDDGANLLVAYRRARNIVEIERTKDGIKEYDSSDLFPDELASPEGEILLKSLIVLEGGAHEKLEAENFVGAMRLLSQIRKPVDDLFDNVTINAAIPSQRLARLKLLSRVVAAMDRIAIFSLIEG